MSKLEKILLLVNIFIYGLLTIFSYAYVDLNLTLSQNPLILSFVKNLQQLGYFHRPTATLIFILFVILTFSFFIFNLLLAIRGKIGLNYLKISTLANTAILILAYPFLSSDLFNYLFDAKIIVNYHASPYTHRPLDFAGDEWLRFMRWTHRYSPYGPLWLGISTIPAILGFGKFILNFITFKIFIGVFHLINTFLIYKILQKINPQFLLLGTFFYAANPLFLTEGVANAHNDIVMATFMLASIYFFVFNKRPLSIFLLILGAGVKYILILNFPWLLVSYIPKFGLPARLSQTGHSPKMVHLKFLIIASLLTMAVFTYLYSSFRITVPFVSAGATQVQFQPWYLFWTLPLIALIPKLLLIILSISLSFGAMLRYLPYLLYGDWNHPTSLEFMQSVITLLPLLTLITFLIIKLFRGAKHIR